MFSIRNAEQHPKVAHLVGQVSGAVTSHWCVMLPRIEAVIAQEPFHRIAALRHHRQRISSQLLLRDSYWETKQVWQPDERMRAPVELWMYFCSDRELQPEYFFQKDVYEAVARILWQGSDPLRQEVIRRAAKVTRKPGQTSFEIFQGVFSRFFLNPGFLADELPTQFALMYLLDRWVQTSSKILTAV